MLLEGDNVPYFEGVNQSGETVTIKDYFGKDTVVIYFYPKNFTPGCTAEACSFRDHYEVFTQLGAVVLGISADSVNSHSRFASRYNLPFTMISDKGNRIRKLFGVKDKLFGLLPGRETFVIDKKGIVRLRFNSMRAKPHIEKALATIKHIEEN